MCSPLLAGPGTSVCFVHNMPYGCLSLLWPSSPHCTHRPVNQACPYYFRPHRPSCSQVLQHKWSVQRNWACTGVWLLCEFWFLCFSFSSTSWNLCNLLHFCDPCILQCGAHRKFSDACGLRWKGESSLSQGRVQKKAKNGRPNKGIYWDTS